MNDKTKWKGKEPPGAERNGIELNGTQQPEWNPTSKKKPKTNKQTETP